MVNTLFDLGRQKFLDGTLLWKPAGGSAFSACLLDGPTVDVGVKLVSTTSGAVSPSTITTTTTHGLAVNDIIYVDGILGNPALNGLWIVSVVNSTTQVTITRPDGTAVTGSGAYTSGGYLYIIGGATGTNCDFYDDFSAAQVGGAAGKVALSGFTNTNGVADAADVTFTAISGNVIRAVAIIRDSGTDTTSELVALISGKHIVTADAQAAAAATTVTVEPLVAPIPNGTVLTFSNGAAATLSALANAGDRALTVTALAAIITAGSRALAPATGSGLPLTPNGGNVNIAWDNGVNKIFKL